MSVRRLLAVTTVLIFGGCTDGRADHADPDAGCHRTSTTVTPADDVFEELVATVRTSLRTERGETTLAERMADLSVPGLAVSVAVNGSLMGSFASGTTPDGQPMTTRTLAQVGSVSKPVAAVGAMSMVADGRLPWADDIAPFLVSYPLPPGAQSADHPVTVAALLSHTAGTTVHGFPGYERPLDAPTLPAVLAGAGNTPAVQVVTEPGSSFSYSGGGYEVLEQMMLDVSGAADFDSLMGALVFDQAGMVDTRYALEVPAEVAARTTPGSAAGTMLSERWRAHPENAAAGLWTTADDLGHFLAALTASLSGVDESLLPAHWARRMVTGVEPAGRGAQIGHGFFVDDEGTEFWHGGVNVGYNSFIAGTVDGHFAVAVVTNADPGGIVISTEVVDTVAVALGWR